MNPLCNHLCSPLGTATSSQGKIFNEQQTTIVYGRVLPALALKALSHALIGFVQLSSSFLRARIAHIT